MTRFLYIVTASALSLFPAAFSLAATGGFMPPPLLEKDVLAFPPNPAPALILPEPIPVTSVDIDQLPTPTQMEADASAYSIALITLPHLLFAHNDARLNDHTQTTLGRAAVYIKQHPRVVRRVLINGHADETASMDYNYALGQTRAEGVRRFLIDSGVRENLLQMASTGESDPTDEGWTTLGRAHNRRVEVFILLEYPAL